MANHADVIEALQHPADWENTRGILIVGQQPFVVANGQVRIARDIIFGQPIVPEPSGVVVPEPIAPIVAMAAILRSARLRFEGAVGRTKAEVAPTDINPLASRLNPPTAVAIGAVEPIVQAIIKTVEPMLLVAFAEAGEERFAIIGFAIAIRIFGEKNLGRGADDDSPAPRHDSGRKVQAIQKHG